MRVLLRGSKPGWEIMRQSLKPPLQQGRQPFVGRKGVPDSDEEEKLLP